MMGGQGNCADNLQRGYYIIYTYHTRAHILRCMSLIVIYTGNGHFPKVQSCMVNWDDCVVIYTLS